MTSQYDVEFIIRSGELVTSTPEKSETVSDINSIDASQLNTETIGGYQ